MAVLEQKIQQQIDTLEDLAYEKYVKGLVDESFQLRKQAWSLYPEPKENWNEAYNSAKYLYEAYMAVGSLSDVREWLNEMIWNNDVHHYSDEECLFYTGKYNFKIGNYKEAYEDFSQVVKIAGLRYFEDEEPEYLEFYKNPEILKTGQ